MLVARVKRSRHDEPVDELCIFEDLEYLEKKKKKKTNALDKLSSSLSLLSTSLTVDNVDNLSEDLQEKIKTQERLKKEYNETLQANILEDVLLRNKIVLKRISTISLSSKKELDQKTAEVLSSSNKRKRGEVEAEATSESTDKSSEEDGGQKKKTSKVIITRAKQSLAVENSQTCILVDMMQLHTRATPSVSSTSTRSKSAAPDQVSAARHLSSSPFSLLSSTKLVSVTAFPSALSGISNSIPIKFKIHSPPTRSLIRAILEGIQKSSPVATSTKEIWTQIMMGGDVSSLFHFKLSTSMPISSGQSSQPVTYWFFNFSIFHYFFLASNLQNLNKFLSIYSEKFDCFEPSLVIFKETSGTDGQPQVEVGTYSIVSMLDYVGSLSRLSQREVNEMKLALTVNISEESKKRAKEAADLSEDVPNIYGNTAPVTPAAATEETDEDYVMDIFAIEPMEVPETPDGVTPSFAPLKNNLEEIREGSSVVHIDGLKILDDGQVEILDDLNDQDDGNLSDLYEDEEIDSNDERFHGNDYPDEEEDGDAEEDRRRRQEDEYDEDIYYDEFYGGDRLQANQRKQREKQDFLYDGVSYSRNYLDEDDEDEPEVDALTQIRKDMKARSQHKKVAFSQDDQSNTSTSSVFGGLKQKHSDFHNTYYMRGSSEFGSMSSLSGFQRERFDSYRRQLRNSNNLDDHMDINFTSGYAYQPSEDEDTEDEEAYDDENEDEMEQHYGGQDD